MDILVKFVPKAEEKNTGLKNYFASLKKVQKYFLKLHKKNGNNNFFFLIRKRRLDTKDKSSNILNQNDNIYFVFEQKIIAKAKYVAFPNSKRSDKFKNGYEVKNVLVLGSPFPLNELEKNPYTSGSRHSVYFIKEDEKVLKNGNHSPLIKISRQRLIRRYFS